MHKHFRPRVIALLVFLGATACVAAFLTARHFTPAYVESSPVTNEETPSLPASADSSPKVVDFTKTSVELASSYVRANASSFYIKVNRQQNTVMVYSADTSGSYSNLVKVFVASTGASGSETPLGTFTVSDRYPALFLVGNVWGQYAVRISGPYFFHSVPYFSKGAPWDDLEYLEYNKLGSPASAGCVRLAVIDAKWIYDHIPAGTTVEIYDSASLPAGVTKPTPIHIDESSPNRGWDPTDPTAP